MPSSKKRDRGVKEAIVEETESDNSSNSEYGNQETQRGSMMESSVINNQAVNLNKSEFIECLRETTR